MQLRKVSLWLLVVAATLLFPLHAIAQDEDVDLDDPFANYDAEELFEEGTREPDWIPSLRLELGVIHHQGLGVLRTPGVLVDLNGDGDGRDLGESDTRGIDNISGVRAELLGTSKVAVDGAVLGGGFEVMGPPFEQVIGDMRFLVVGGMRDMLEGNTAVVRAQTQPPPFSIAKAQIRTKGKFLIDRWYYAGVGAAFQLPVEDFNIKLKPSINYVYIEGMYTTFLVQEVLQLPTGKNQDFPRQSEIGVTNHAIAPRIELDAEVYKQGPISVGVFASFETQFIIGGPLNHSGSVQSCYGDGPASCANVDGSAGTLTFDYERDAIIYHGGIGVRMSWVGGP